MKRIDTMTDSAKFYLERTIQEATITNNAVSFDCTYHVSMLDCRDCPFWGDDLTPCSKLGSRDKRTADEWRSWAEEDI